MPNLLSFFAATGPMPEINVKSSELVLRLGDFRFGEDFGEDVTFRFASGHFLGLAACVERSFASVLSRALTVTAWAFCVT